jgi:hypothetical protein
MTQEALKLALDFVETVHVGEWVGSIERQEKAITAIKEALAQLALDAKAENARELGLDYEPEPVSKYCCHLCFNKSGLLLLDRMILCSECGNKRCPKATNHALQCTNSNEPNQAGSVFTNTPQRTEQEPVAWVAEDVCEGQYIDGRPRKIWWECEKGVGMAFYTHPPQRTELKIKTTDPFESSRVGDYNRGWNDCLFASGIVKQPEQEPCNVRERWNVELDGNDLLVCFNDHEKGDKCQYERYSPQRTWVGLTDVEIDYLLVSTAGENEETHISFARAIESKLKQNNGYAEENT